MRIETRSDGSEWVHTTVYIKRDLHAFARLNGINITKTTNDALMSAVESSKEDVKNDK